MELPNTFLELMQNPYFYGPMIGITGLFLAGKWFEFISNRRASK